MTRLCAVSRLCAVLSRNSPKNPRRNEFSTKNQSVESIQQKRCASRAAFWQSALRRMWQPTSSSLAPAPTIRHGQTFFPVSVQQCKATAFGNAIRSCVCCVCMFSLRADTARKGAHARLGTPQSTTLAFSVNPGKPPLTARTGNASRRH